jgi:hypothetical protein
MDYTDWMDTHGFLFHFIYLNIIIMFSRDICSTTAFDANYL